MGGYWLRHRLIPSLVFAVLIAVIASTLFVFPFVENKAGIYNEQSIYKNSLIDFIAPEPSYEQVMDLPGTEGIDKVFPFYLTKTNVEVNGKTRTTSVLLSNQFDNIDITMYNDKRLIEKLDTAVENPILVDWKFIKETSAKIGDTVSFSLNGTQSDFIIQAIYETNTIYDGGAVVAHISEQQKNAIADNADSKGYSAIYISSEDYSKCKSYLATDYRPLGRLRDREQFDSDEQYNVHYNAIMESGYSNEITDFRDRESRVRSYTGIMMPLLGAILVAIFIIAFNAIMSARGCEKGYFTKHCIPKGIKVNPYYNTSFIFESLCFVSFYAMTFILQMKLSRDYIPNSVVGVMVVLIPAVVVVAEIIALFMNNSKVAVILANYKATEEARKKAEEETRENLESNSGEKAKA